MTDNEARLAQQLVDEVKRGTLERSGEVAFSYIGLGALAFVGAVVLTWITFYVFSSLAEYHDYRRRWARGVQEAQADYAGALAVSDFEKATGYQALVEKRRAMEPPAPEWAFWHKRAGY